MKLGRQSAYAIDGLLVLTAKPFGTVMLLRDIARSRNVAESFLAKIFQKLTRGGLVVSSRGAIRGYALARKSKDIKTKDIFKIEVDRQQLDVSVIAHEPTGPIGR